jgi:hypothetical protein
VKVNGYRFKLDHTPQKGRKQVRFPCPACKHTTGLGLALKLENRPGLHRQCRSCRHIEPIQRDPVTT